MNLDKNYKYVTETVALVKNLEEGFLVLGERLKRIRDERLYLPSYDNFEIFLMECRLTPSKASRLISVYETYVEKFGFDPEKIAAVGWSLLYEAVPLLISKQKATEVLHELTERADRDGRIYIREARSGLAQEDCAHRDVYVLKVCRTCGDKQKIDAESLR